MVDDFYLVRPGIWFAPNGLKWEFEGVSFLALGGAYSIDKANRLAAEIALSKEYFDDQYAMHGKEYDDAWLWEKARIKAKGQYWFPEEEMTDQELDDILRRVKNVDVILAHDKPLASNPLMKLLPIEQCIPNQRRLQKAVNVLQPKLFVHGHLHVRYTDTIRCGDNNRYTRVEGLGADVPNFNQRDADWAPRDAWEILDL
jgi:hypothetical protein